jgi:hypothetical protein
MEKTYLKNKMPDLFNCHFIGAKPACFALLILVTIFGCPLKGQNVGINSTGATPDASAMLDISSPNKGMLIPRLALTGVNDATTISNPQTSLLVYNTASTISGTGYYYNSETTAAPVWVKLLTSASASGWQLTGNSGTSSGINFLGTTDGQPLLIKVNNTQAGYLDYLSSKANTSFGYQALSVNTGKWNTAFGYQALYSNTSGMGNVAVGIGSLYSSTTGNHKIAIGDSALYTETLDTTENVAIGYKTLYLNTIGYHNTAIGTKALYSNTYSIGNTAIGHKALSSFAVPATNNSLNTAVGDYALTSNTNGVQNTAIGQGALMFGTTGSSCTAVGCQSMINTTGDGNTAIGNLSLKLNTTGDNNTAIGTQALKTNTTGGNNTALGYLADVSSANLTNATAIGYNSKVGISNAIVLGGTVTNTVAVGIGTISPVAILHTVANGSKTTAYSSNLFTNFVTSSTSNIKKASVEIKSTGNWTGTSASNIGLYVSSVTGGTANYDAIFNGGGNVGIGTATPTSPLEVSGAIKSGYLISNSTSGVLSSFGSSDAGIYYKTGGALQLVSAGNDRVIVTSSGQVGIGTTNPTNALVDIVGSVNSNPGSYRYMNNTTQANASCSSCAYSLYTNNRIWCSGEINITSDKRTKEILDTSDSKNDLKLINQLKVVDYQYVDKVNKGNTIIKGFEAQQVEEIFPNAVSQNTGFIPDIYQNASSVQFDTIHKTLLVIMTNEHNLKAGDKIQVIEDSGTKNSIVAEVIDDRRFMIKWDKPTEWLFVYGKEVSDLRNLDYNKIFSAGISAIQQLSKEVTQLKEENELLKRNVSSIMGIESENKILQESVKLLQLQMHRLEASLNSN